MPKHNKTATLNKLQKNLFAIGVHIKYDDDVKFYSYKAPNGEVHNYGARTQFKQVLGVGVLYTF